MVYAFIKDAWGNTLKGEGTVASIKGWFDDFVNQKRATNPAITR